MALLSFLRLNARWLSAAFLMAFASGFGQTFYIAVFAGEIRAGFGLSHGQWGGLYSLCTMASAALMVFVGGLTDRFRARDLGALSLGLLGLACLAMSVITSVWALALVIFALRFAGQGMASHTALVATSRWFVAARGRALAIAAMGFSLAEAVLPLTFVAAMAVIDWRILWGLAALGPLLAIPVLIVLLRVERTPRSDPEVSIAAGMDGRHWTRAEMLRNPVFWLVAPMMIAPTCFGTALIFQQVHLSNSKGWDLVDFVALFPLYTLCIVAGVLITGWAIDRWGAVRLMPIYQMPLALSYLLFWQAETLSGAMLAFVFFGLGTGTHGPTSSAFWAEAYGTRHLGTIRALTSALLVLGSAIGPGFSGFLIDAGVLFSDQMPWFTVYVLATSALTWAVVGRVLPRLAATPKIDVIGAGPAMADVGLGHLQHDRPEGR